jgi:hypothetical protein
MSGTIRDERGQGIGGAMVIALGPTTVSARTDPAGRFTLPLPPGEYVIRATRDGFISTYREVVRVPNRTVVERHIRLNRRGAAVPPPPRDAAADPQQAPNHAHDEAAWRLRRLPPTVLRDSGAVAGDWTPEPGDGVAPRMTFLEWARQESRRAAGYIAGLDFTGHVNYFAAGSIARAGESVVEAAPTRVADLAIGAPVGSRGDWTLRGVVDAGRRSVWALHGEYRSRDGFTHTLAVGGFYTAHTSAIGAPSDSLPQAIGRRVSGAYLLDRWHAHPSITLDYGVRVDRYDHLEEDFLAGGRIGVRASLPGVTAVGSATRSVFAPGSDEFLLPSSAGPWVPPLRTFSSLGGAAFDVERVRHLDVGVERRFGEASGAHRVISVRWFRESTLNQPAVIFGLGVGGDRGHYQVGTPGSFDMRGWTVDVDSEVTPAIAARVQYTMGDVDWQPGAGGAALEPFVASAVRAGAERVHDVRASVEAALPRTGTAVLITYRVSSAFSDAESHQPGAAGRFALQVNHALPCEPFDGGRLELLFALRTLYRDLEQPGSIYDELLTVSPPLRMLGGMRIRF